jgi:hydrogenase maturation factor
MSRECFPVGKLPAPVLADLLARLPRSDPSVVVGPGIGVDCAVVRTGDGLLVCKSDPITFVTRDLGHYLVQVNANDLATTGATPRWLMVTLLLPQAAADREMVDDIMGQIALACEQMGVTLVGGHTEITHGLDRPIAVGCLLGEVADDALVTPQGARPGDRILLTKGVPIEGTAILAGEFAERLRDRLDAAELEAAKAYLWQPGISVLRDARVALGAGQVTAMHDPTEGGLLTALWELAQACGHTLRVDLAAVPVPALAARICRALEVDPLATIASGALLLTTPARDSEAIRRALDAEGIPCAEIGEVGAGAACLVGLHGAGERTIRPPERDEVARLLQNEHGSARG